ncbi:MAG TPA: glycoside hydrolase family 16 protein [Sporichthya sp.]|nr:glycoside hydrolase family 16 protein [Sporichthya sp.]
MHRRVQTRLWAGVSIALVAALAACGSDSNTPAASPSPVVTLDATPIPIPSDAPSSDAGANGEANSPFTSGAVPESVAEGYHLVFGDDFDGTALGPDWAFRNRQPATRLCSALSEDQIVVRDGSLHLSVARDESKVPNVTKDCPDGHYLNGMIGTDDTKAFFHGIFSARIKFHAPQGAHGSFWMQPAAVANPGDPNDPFDRGVEIDVIEYFGKGWINGGLSHFIHFQPEQGKRLRAGGYLRTASDALNGGGLPSDDYHVYSVEWTDKEYIFRVDGKETFRTSRGLSGRPEYFILSLLSSYYELPKITDDVLPMTMSVDWVRAWQR